MKRIKQLMMLVFTICLISLAIPITTHADVVDNAGGSGSVGTGGKAQGGASQNKHGYRFYVVDKHGEVVSKVVDLTSDSSIDCDINARETRIGGTNASKVLEQIPSDMPKPFYHDGSSFRGNGEALKNWCLSNGDNGKQKIVILCLIT